MNLETSWRTAPFLCDICSQEWVGVLPALDLKAECPNCGHMNSVPDVYGDMEADYGLA